MELLLVLFSAHGIASGIAGGEKGTGYWVAKNTRFSQPCKAADCKTRVDPTELFAKVPKFDYLKFISTTFRYKSS